MKIRYVITRMRIALMKSFIIFKKVRHKDQLGEDLSCFAGSAP
jgi:hypothetical protein